MSTPQYLGIDVGTSGVRACLIDASGNELAAHQTAMAAPVRDGNSSLQDSQLWIRAVDDCLEALSSQHRLEYVEAVAVDATSSTVLLCQHDGTPLTAAMMYNDCSSVKHAEHIATVAPPDSGAHGASSSLAKLLEMNTRWPELSADLICHQADYIKGYLCGRYDVSDENNCLKLGYDIQNRTWPTWLEQLDIDRKLLPEVVAAGTVVANISNTTAQRYGFSTSCKMVSGTTDSIAAFMATGANEPGDAVTSLGSSLVIKQLTRRAIFDADTGVYSHRYPSNAELWLAGGASNSGCKVLSEIFDQQQLDELSQQLDPETETGLNYTALPAGSRGERFPEANVSLEPCITPVPDNQVTYLQGLLESIARVEQRGYARLQQLGCETASRIISCGGGSNNVKWNSIRERMLGIPVTTAQHSEASYGAALLARFAMTRS